MKSSRTTAIRSAIMASAAAWALTPNLAAAQTADAEQTGEYAQDDSEYVVSGTLLRNLSPETGSSSSTLVLFDGHRIAGGFTLGRLVQFGISK